CGACQNPCGDGYCDPASENCSSCPADCGACQNPCGDGVCDPASENCSSCPTDCGACQSGRCAGTYGGISGVHQVCLETADTCELHYNSTVQTCAQICSQGGGTCSAVYNNLGACGHAEALTCGDNGYESAICICATGGCGDGVCNSASENCSSCPT